MNKLKFAKDEGSVFYKELNEQVDAYFAQNGRQKTGNSTMKAKIALYFSLDIFLYYLMVSSQTALNFYTFYCLMGISILLTAFNISHDAAHGVAVKSKFWNKLLFQISFNLQGNNAYVWGKNHTESHHLYTNIEGSDIDVLDNPLLRMTDTQTLKKHHRFQHVYAPFLYLFYSINWFFFRDLLMLFNLSSRTISINIPLIEAIKLVVFKLIYIGYMIVLPMYVLPFNWTTILLAFILNHFIISLIFTAVLGVAHLSDYVEHPLPNNKGQLSMSWAKLQLLTSVDYNSNSRFLNWTLGGFNAHALHHLLPNVCHIHYLDLLPIFRQLIDKHGLVYMEMPYPKSLAAHFRFLKTMGNQEQFKAIAYEK
jgi:linoleoyl-CoA desaturase